MNRPAVLTDQHYTYEDYLKFPEDERWEIIDGVAYSMSPAPATEHQSGLMEMGRQIANQLQNKPCRVFIAPFDVRFDRSRKTAQVVQPDLLVVCDPAKIVRAGLVGAPDWIVEVLSPTTAGKDQIIKKNLYQREGVREYWLVHPHDRIVTVYRLAADGRFGPPEILEMTGRLAVACLSGVEIDWDLWQPLELSDES